MERKCINITFININALTEDKEEEEMENVYAQLWIWIQAMMSKSSWGGGTNAKIGQEREYYTIIGGNTVCKTHLTRMGNH